MARQVVTVRFSADELAVLEARAQERGCPRSEVLRALVKDGQPRRDAGPLGEQDLVELLEERARAGNVRAIELLLARVTRSEQPPASQFAEFDELAARRAG